MGSLKNCLFCDLIVESEEHILWEYGKAKICWMFLNEVEDVDIHLRQGFTTGEWILQNFNSRLGNLKIKALIANCGWLIWSTRCYLSFKQGAPNFVKIFQKAAELTWRYCSEREDSYTSLCNNDLIPCQTAIFSDASWVNSSLDSGLGFAIITHPNYIVCASSLVVQAESSLHAEAKVMFFFFF